MAAEGPDEERRVFLATIQRDINCLSDNDRSTRKRALGKLEKRLFSASEAPTPEILQDVFVKEVLPPTVRCLADQVEKCRELSIVMLEAAAKMLLDVNPLLPQVLPMILVRIGQTPVVEPSEEIRLALVELLSGPLIQRADATTMMGVKADLMQILGKSAEDNFHEIVKKVSNSIVAAASTFPPGAMESHTSSLLKALVPQLQHRHSQVRLTVFRAVDSLVMNGCSEETFLRTVLPAVVKLVADHTPNIRAAVTEALARWLLGAKHSQWTDPTVPQALLAFPEQLLPLMLLGVSDENEPNAVNALALVESVGAEYKQRKEAAVKDRKEKVEQEMAQRKAAGGEKSVKVQIEEDDDEDMDEAEGAAGPMKVDEPGPADGDIPEPELGVPRTKPFTGRAGRGCRALVEDMVKDLLTPVLKELREWTTFLRMQAARILYVLLAIAEGAVEDHLHLVLPVLCLAVGDDDPAIASSVVQSAQMLGNFAKVEVWTPLLLEAVIGDKLTVQQRANGLVVMAALLRGTVPARLAPEALARLAAAASSEELRASDSPAVRRQVYAVTTNLISAGGSGVSTCGKELFLVLLQLGALEDDHALAEATGPTMEALAAGCQLDGVPSLYDLHAEHLLAVLKAEEPNWQSESSGRFLFTALVRGFTAPQLEQHMDPVLPIVAACLHLDRDPHMKLAMLAMLDELFEHPAKGPAFRPAAQIIVLHLLTPSCVWRSGKTMAAVRYHILVAFGTLLRNKLCSQEDFVACLNAENDVAMLPTFFSCMEEDYYSDTRRAGTYLMEQFLLTAGAGLTDEQRRAIYPELLKRMDDSNDEIRLRAASCILAFFAPLGLDGYDDSNTGYFLQGAMIHMDDADPRIQEAVCAALEAAAAVKPLVVIEKTQEARPRHRSSTFCDRVLAKASHVVNQHNLQ